MLEPKYKYLQIALNRSLAEAKEVIAGLPASNRIIIEAGTVFIKRYGEAGIKFLVSQWQEKVGGQAYVLADMKCMDRGLTEVQAASRAGAKAITCLGLAPPETIDAFCAAGRQFGLQTAVDMLNVKFPFEILSKLKQLPDIVILHRGVDEATNREKMIPYHDIVKIKSTYNVFIAIAGGEEEKLVQRAFFNSADIAIVWQKFAQQPASAEQIAQKFLALIKGYALVKTR